MNVKSFQKYILTGLLGGALLLSACNHYVDKTDARIETVLERTEMYSERATIPDLPEPVDTVRMNNDIWLGNSSVKIMQGDAFPAKFEQDDSVTFAISKNATLPDLAQELTDTLGIEVRIDDLKAENAIPKNTVAVNYSGKLSGLLNYLANRYGVWWRYKNGQISFFTKETRVFTVYALPTETKLTADLKGASMGSGKGTNTGSSSLSTSANLALWDSIEKGVQQVVGKQGELSFSRVAGTVTVTASPFVVQKVASYIADWNEKLSRQVAISIKVLQVQLSNEDNYGLDLNAVFKTNNIDTSFSSPYSLATAASGSSAGGLLSMTLLKPNSKWKDSQAIIEAFSTQGKTSLVTSSSVTTLNNKVAPVQITTSQNYVKEVSVTNNYGSSTTNSEVELETDTLNYGFSMEILPKILDHGRLIVLFSMTLSDLIQMDTFSSNSLSNNDDDSDSDSNDGEATSVQLPKMQIRGFMQEIAMKSGSTLVLTGFEQTGNTETTSGIGQAKMNLLGGRAYDQHRRDVMVILMTPEVLESPMAPESRMREF